MSDRPEKLAWRQARKKGMSCPGYLGDRMVCACMMGVRSGYSLIEASVGDAAIGIGIGSADDRCRLSGSI